MPAHPVKRTPTSVANEQKARTTPFLEFQYSYSEFTVMGDKTHVKSRRTRLEDGKLMSEAFEGELPRNVYGEMVADAQRRFLAQTELLLSSFAPFLRRR